MKPFDLMHKDYHLGHFYIDTFKSRPNAICQIDAATGEKETNASVLSRSISLARCFRKFGLKPGDVLALGGRNHLDLHIPYYAALLNGLPIVGVDPLFKFNEIKTLFKLCVPRIAFCQTEHYDDYVQAAKELGLDIKVVSFDEGSESLKSFMEAYADEQDDSKFEVALFDLDKVYVWLVSTGGTTGTIKLAAFKHKIWIEKILSFRKLFATEKKPENADNGENRPALNLSPVQWISGFFNALGMPILKQIKVQTSANPTTEHVIDIINKYRPITCLVGPTLFSAILKNEMKCDLTCFDSIILTGGKVYKDIIIELRKRVRPDTVITEAYGQTENLGPVFAPNPTGPIGNCGRGMYPAHEGKLVDPKTGLEINEPNVPGELWTKGFCLSEYYNNPEATRRAFTEDGWFKTGDVLYRDEDGNYFFVERLNMLIKCRGYHVIPPELEAVIREHPAVLDVNVTSIPHEEDGERPVACVVKAPGKDVTAQEIKDLVAKNLSVSKHLRGGVIFLDELPLTSAGKVARAKLRQMVLNLPLE